MKLSDLFGGRKQSRTQVWPTSKVRKKKKFESLSVIIPNVTSSTTKLSLEVQNLFLLDFTNMGEADAD